METASFIGAVLFFLRSRRDTEMPVKNMEFYGSQEMPDEEIAKLIAEEVARTPKNSAELVARLSENTSSSPATSGGDIDADWEDSEDTGDESVFGHNPTPDQSDVEQNAHAMGIDFRDDEPLDFLRKIEGRDEDRYELDEDSARGGSI
jgi:hypothetical protein